MSQNSCLNLFPSSCELRVFTIFLQPPLYLGQGGRDATSFIRRAGRRIRTDDLLITNQLLYQLSYAGFGKRR
jgi:hypothetical protein